MSISKDEFKVFQANLSDKNIAFPWQDFKEMCTDDLTKLHFSDYKTMAENQFANIDSNKLPNDIITKIYSSMMPSWTNLE